MSEEDYKRIIMFYTQLRDTCNEVSKLSDKILKDVIGPINSTTRNAKDIEKDAYILSGKIIIELGKLNNIINVVDEVLGKGKE